jgi:hypothetical protein
MKQGKLHWVFIFILTVTSMLLVAHRSHAYYTNFLDTASNTLSVGYHSLTNTATNAVQRRQAALMLRALRDLAKPSTSVAGDYNLFVAAATHLGPLAFSPEFGPIGTNTFLLFTNEAQAQINATQARIAALNNFVRNKRPASNAAARAQATLDSIPTLTNPQIGILLVRQVFVQIATANRLAAFGETHSGFAANTVIGKNLQHSEPGNTGSIFFNNDVQATQDALLDTMYTYTRTGLNTATLVLVQTEGAETNTTTVKLRFTSTSGGTFTYRSVDSSGGSVETGAGTFTIN